MPSLKQTTLTGVVIFVFCQIFFLIYIQFPSKVNFDEFHYVPAARDFLEGKAAINWEHPPLGKMLIATGIRIAGDRPFGWRLPSTTAGALTLVGIYFLALIFFNSARSAEWVALLTLCNFFLYVQSRIALLDGFMVMFLVWGLVFQFRALAQETFSGTAQKSIIISGCLFGLALGCKWPALPALPLGVGFLTLRFRKPALAWALGCFGLLPLLVYVLILTPLLFMKGFPYHGYDLIRLHQDIINGLTAKNDPHFYESKWYQWPFMVRSIWYAFDRDGTHLENIRGVFLIGNPRMPCGILIVSSSPTVSCPKRPVFTVTLNPLLSGCFG